MFHGIPCHDQNQYSKNDFSKFILQRKVFERVKTNAESEILRADFLILTLIPG